MLIRNSVKSIGGCHNVKATITPEMRKPYVSAPARKKEFLEKRKADESKEAEDTNVKYNLIEEFHFTKQYLLIEEIHSLIKTKIC